MNTLERIVLRKREEVAAAKAQTPASALERQPLFDREPLSLAEAVRQPGASGLICEFKRRSPSKGLINGTATPAETVSGYERAGASAASVLTDADFFGGSPDDLRAARQAATMPLLRKDFVIDEYQLLEAKAWGADVALLIAACLKPAESRSLAKFARELGLSVLLELHGQDELGHVNEYASAIGVNNRDLKTFAVDVNVSLQMLEKLPKEAVKISESGLSDPKTVLLLRQAGYEGFLIGENFMKTADPASACQAFIEALRQ